MDNYDPESYWSSVGEQIKSRDRESHVAGDDNPYLRYKRRKFLTRFLRTIDFNGKVGLEVGCGPGGNLLDIALHQSPRKLIGVDISQVMVDLARQNLSRRQVIAELHKIDGIHLPFADQSIDISFTVTVLQHDTDGAMLQNLAQEMGRVTSTAIVAMEDTGNAGLSGPGNWIPRRVDVYESVFAPCGFELADSRYLKTRFSRSWYFWIRRRFPSKAYQEGETMAPLPGLLVASLLPITRILDEVSDDSSELTKMVFHRKPGSATG
jgi:SAM-dependent methyltransferase